MEVKSGTVPKKIWMLWYQGLENAPYLVKKCIASWKEKNPTWEVVVLDSTNLQSYLDFDLNNTSFQDLGLALQSDLVRVSLLKTFGGVWADATSYCMLPLNSWIDEASKLGFFVYRNPGKDRVMSSWFILSSKANPLSVELYNKLYLYLEKHNFKKPNKIQMLIIKYLSKILNRKTTTTKYWLHPLVSKVFKVYPYFIFHYIFENLVRTDNRCKYIWSEMKKVSADKPHKIQRLGFFSAVDEGVIEELKIDKHPIFKLTWKYDIEKYRKGTLLYELLEGKIKY